MRSHTAALLVALVLLAPAAASAQARSPVQLGAAINDGGFTQQLDARYRQTLARYDAVVAESAFKIDRDRAPAGGLLVRRCRTRW